MLYEAKLLETRTKPGTFKAAGTLCGHIDFVVPRRGTFTMTTDEIAALIVMLSEARDDVLQNTDPENDPRLYDAKVQ